MIPGERIERSQLHPTRAKLLSRIQMESADVCSYHLNPKYLMQEVTRNR